MSRTRSELVADLWMLLRCDPNDIKIEEDHIDIVVRVHVNESDVEDSMFDREQLSHIVESLTPLQTPTEVVYNE